jgi:hypothetical protein
MQRLHLGRCLQRLFISTLATQLHRRVKNQVIDVLKSVVAGELFGIRRRPEQVTGDKEEMRETLLAFSRNEE